MVWKAAKVSDVASQFDINPRLAALRAQGLTVGADYKSNPPSWLTTALKSCDLFVVNVRGVKPNDTPVLIRLSKLEGLLHELDELRGLLSDSN